MWVAFAGVVVAWGSSYLLIRLAIGSFTPFGLVASRFCAASLLCVGIASVRGESFPRGQQIARLALLGVMMMSGSNALTAYAPGFTHASLAVSSLGGWLWLTVVSSCGMRLSPRGWQPGSRSRSPRWRGSSCGWAAGLAQSPVNDHRVLTALTCAPFSSFSSLVQLARSRSRCRCWARFLRSS